VGAAGKKGGKQKKKDGGRKKASSSPKISKKMSKAGEEDDEEGEEDEAGGEVGDGEMDEEEERLRAQIHEAIDQWTPVLIQRVHFFCPKFMPIKTNSIIIYEFYIFFVKKIKIIINFLLHNITVTRKERTKDTCMQKIGDRPGRADHFIVARHRPSGRRGQVGSFI
jgi:hypothetical protein